ncbi:MAG: alpha/beta fold hydrolase [Propionibacteriales bacterium]|nr:alpha/beta fold hydrolase [Propionibacteriales bacterium]
MNKVRRVVLAGWCALCVALAGCDGLSSDTPEAGSTPTPPEPMPPAPPGLQQFYDQDVTWEECEGSTDFECTTVRVPLDYARPDGRTLGLAVSRRVADSETDRIGAILLNPGGPGGSGIDFAPAAVSRLDGEVLKQFDLVGFDPRGVARSEGLDCLSDAELDEFLAVDPSPENAGEVVELLRSAADLGRHCVDADAGLAAHMSTTEVARDLEVIRSVVRSPDLHYLGTSYGTLLGATYADLYPERVGRMVLDAALDPSLGPVDTSLIQARGFETAVRAYLANCVSQDCPLGDSVAEAARGLHELLEEIDEQPLPAAGGRELTVSNAIYGVWLPLYVADLQPQLTQALEAAQDGDGSPLLALSDFYTERGPEGYQGNTMEALAAVTCLEREGPELTEERVRKLLPRFERASPTFGDVFAWGLLGCSGWPVETSDPIPEIDAPDAPPIPVIGGTRDPATPYEFAEGLAGDLRSGVLVTRVGDGHGSFGSGNQCIADLVNRFFADGEVPEDGVRCS